MKLTREQAILEHRKMWNWIADEMERTGRFIDKTDYFDYIGTPTDLIPHAECFCCEYGVQFVEGEGNFTSQKCALCPLIWDSNVKITMCLDKTEKVDAHGLYALWGNALCDIRVAAKLAR